MTPNTCCTKKIGILICTIALTLCVHGLFTPTIHAQQQNAAANAISGDTNLAAKLNKEEADHDFGCFSTKNGKGMFDGCAALLAYYFMKAGGALAIWVGTGLNWVIQYLIVGMGQLVGNLSGITVAWAVLRDLANVFLVFITVLIGMSMIVGATTYGSKQLLFKVVIAALFVNFSITLTKAVIDVTNIFTVATYQMLITESKSTNVKEDCVKSPYNSGIEAKKDPCVHTGVAGIFVSKLEVLTLLNYTENMNTEAKQAAASEIMWLGLMGGIMLFVMAFVFGAAAVLLVIRFAVLCVLIIFSPIAFVLWVTGVSGQGKQWWNTLLSQSLLAPALMLMWWIAFMIFDGFNTIFPNRSQISQGGLMNGAESVAPIVIVAQFFVLIAIFIMSLIVARSMASHGGAMLVNATDRFSRRWLNEGPRNAWNTGPRAWYNQKRLETIDRQQAEANRKDENGNYVSHSPLAVTRRLKNVTGSYRRKRARMERRATPETARRQVNATNERRMEGYRAQQDLLGSAGLVNEWHAHQSERDIRDEVARANPGMTGTDLTNLQDTTLARVQDARRAVGDASAQNLEWLQNENRGVFTGAGVAAQISAGQMEALESSNTMNAEVRNTVQGERIRQFVDRLATTPPQIQTLRSLIRNMSKNERRTLGRLLSTRVTNPTATGAFRGTVVNTLMGESITMLSDNALLLPDVIDHLESTHLSALTRAERLDGHQRATIRTRIVGPPPHGTATAQRFFGTDAGLSW